MWRPLCVLFDYFFSSRRRHTRLQGDWSSDVCSSDLHVRSVTTLLSGRGRRERHSAKNERADGQHSHAGYSVGRVPAVSDRKAACHNRDDHADPEDVLTWRAWTAAGRVTKWPRGSI